MVFKSAFDWLLVGTVSAHPNPLLIGFWWAHVLLWFMTLIRATNELLIYVFGVRLDNIRKMDWPCGGLVLGFGRVGGLLWAFGFLGFWVAFGTLLAAIEIFSSWWAFGGLSISFWLAFGGHPVMFIFHSVLCYFGGLGGFLLCWWWLMSAFGGLLMGSCWCEILMVVLAALACLLLV